MSYSPISFCKGMITPVCQYFCAIPEHQDNNWHSFPLCSRLSAFHFGVIIHWIFSPLSVLTALGSTKGNVLQLFATKLSSAYLSSRWRYSCFEQLRNSRPLCTLGAIGARTIRNLQRYFIFFHYGLPLLSYALLVLHVWLGSGGFSRCKLQTSRWWSVDSSLPPLARTSITERNKSAEPMAVEPKDLCTRCTRAHICCGRTFPWCTVHCYTTVAAGAFSDHLRHHHNVG